MEKFTGCKVFSATLARDRDSMTETINGWLAKHPELDIVDKTVTLSSDNQFHCLTIILFFRERGA
jgi:hypothetical protein